MTGIFVFLAQTMRVAVKWLHTAQPGKGPVIVCPAGNQLRSHETGCAAELLHLRVAAPSPVQLGRRVNCFHSPAAAEASDQACFLGNTAQSLFKRGIMAKKEFRLS